MATTNPLFEDIPVGAAITAIDPLPSDPNQRRMKVDGRTAATLPVAAVEQLGLRVGDEWTAERARAVARSLETMKARKTALGMLGRRSHARRELVERLESKGFDAGVAAAVVAEIAEHGWLDDREHARQLAAEIVRKRPIARELLVQRLEDRSVDPALAREVASETLGGVDETEAAIALARRKLESMPGADARTASRRIAGLLVRRGFEEETIRTVLDRLELTNPVSDG